MEKSPASINQPNRPSNIVHLALFGILIVGGAWYMRIETALAGLPIDIAQNIEKGIIANGLPLKATYTHIAPVDKFLTTLVASFAGGPFAFDEGVRVQQIHFLIQFIGILCIWNVEACRTRNAGRAISMWVSLSRELNIVILEADQVRAV